MIIDGPAGKRGMMTSEGKSQRTFPPREGARNARFFKGQFSSATLFSGATATTGAPVSDAGHLPATISYAAVRRRTRFAGGQGLPKATHRFSLSTDLLPFFVRDELRPVTQASRLHSSCEVRIETDSLLTSTGIILNGSTELRAFHCGLWIVDPNGSHGPTPFAYKSR